MAQTTYRKIHTVIKMDLTFGFRGSPAGLLRYIRFPCAARNP